LNRKRAFGTLKKNVFNTIRFSLKDKSFVFDNFGRFSSYGRFVAWSAWFLEGITASYQIITSKVFYNSIHSMRFLYGFVVFSIKIDIFSFINYWSSRVNLWYVKLLFLWIQVQRTPKKKVQVGLLFMVQTSGWEFTKLLTQICKIYRGNLKVFLRIRKNFVNFHPAFYAI